MFLVVTNKDVKCVGATKKHFLQITHFSEINPGTLLIFVLRETPQKIFGKSYHYDMGIQNVLNDLIGKHNTHRIVSIQLIDQEISSILKKNCF